MNLLAVRLAAAGLRAAVHWARWGRGCVLRVCGGVGWVCGAGGGWVGWGGVGLCFWWVCWVGGVYVFGGCLFAGEGVVLCFVCVCEFGVVA